MCSKVKSAERRSLFMRRIATIFFGIAGMAVSLHAEAGWIYDSAGKTLTEGNVADGATAWVFNCQVSGSQLRVTTVKQTGTNPVLNFRAAISASDGTDLEITEVGAESVGTETGLLSGNTNICEVYLPDTVTYIGSCAFRNCSSLTNIWPLLPDSIVKLGHGAFYGAPLKGTLRLGFGSRPETVVFAKNLWNENKGFFGTSQIGEFIAGPRVEQIPDSFFTGCKALTNVVLQTTNLLSIGWSAFHQCSSLTSVTPFLPDTLISIGSRSFQNTGVNGTLRLGFGPSFKWQPSVWNENYHFLGSKVNNVILGPKVTSCPAAIFENLESLISVDFRSRNLQTVGARAFQNAKNMREVRFASCPTFGASPFLGVPSTARFFLAYEADGWTTWLANAANATPWDELTEANQALYYEQWGEYARKPKARTLSSHVPFPENSWLLRYSLYPGGTIFLF